MEFSFVTKKLLKIHSPQTGDVSPLLLVKDLLQFDSRKRPSPVSDQSLFAFWVVAYSPGFSIVFKLRRIPDWKFSFDQQGSV